MSRLPRKALIGRLRHTTKYSPIPFFALCFDTHDAKHRGLAEQAEMLKELGYDGAGHLELDGLSERVKTLDAKGLKLFQVYLQVNIAPARQPYDPRLKDALPLLAKHETMLAISVGGGKPSDVGGDGRAVEIIREIADLARPHGLRIALYPHANNWLERVEDAVRVADKVDRRNVGIMFNLCHWLKVDDRKNLGRVLKSAIPRLVCREYQRGRWRRGARRCLGSTHPAVGLRHF